MPTIKSQAKRVEVIHEIDISNIDWSLYPRPKKLLIAFTIDDLDMRLAIYPHGKQEAKPNFCTFSWAVVNAKEDDGRHINMSVQLAPTEMTLDSATNVSSFLGGEALKRYSFRSTILKNSKCLQINAVLCQDAHYVIPTIDIKRSFTKQLTRAHAHSLIFGDVTLVIKLQEGANDECDLDAPPLKKLKMNQDLSNNEEEKQEIELKMDGFTLKCASPVFDGMLSANMMEQEQKRVTVIAKSVKDVKDLLYFMSTDVLRDDCNAINVMELAQFYQMKRLIWKCINRMIQNVSVENFVETIHVFERYDIGEGYQTLVNFGKKNIAELKKQPNYLSLPHSLKYGALNDVPKRVRKKSKSKANLPQNNQNDL